MLRKNMLVGYGESGGRSAATRLSLGAPGAPVTHPRDGLGRPAEAGFARLGLDEKRSFKSNKGSRTDSSESLVGLQRFNVDTRRQKKKKKKGELAYFNNNFSQS